jgi:ABC-type lipoprotein release transport system permease subunit
VADGVGAPPAVTPVLAVLVIVAAAVALANLVAVFPARAAARIRPALALRAE